MNLDSGLHRQKMGLAIALAVLGLALPTISFGQIPGEIETRRILSKGSTEEKRDLLSSIQSGGDEVMSEMALIAFKDKNPVVRSSAIAAAQRTPHGILIPALGRVARDGSVAVRKQAADVLGQTGSPDAVAILIQRLAKERDREVRTSVIKALGLTGSTSEISILVGELTRKSSEKNEFERAMAARSLGQIARRARGENPATSIPSSFNEMAVPVSFPRSQQIQPIESFRNMETLVIGLATAAGESMNVRRECAFLLGEVGGAESIPALESLMKEEDPYLSRIAHESLKRLATRAGSENE
jgi:hypothetical protein